MKTGVIIQARSSSSRLPGKILLPLPYGSNITVLENVIQRIRRSKHINEVIVATTMNNGDDKIEELAGNMGVKVFRGNEYNVLERFYLAAETYKLHMVVRVTSDCPCIDPGIIDQVIQSHFYNHADFTSNAIERTYPVGQDVSVFSFENLRNAYENATMEFEKEHVTPYFYKTRPDKFKINIVKAPSEFYFPELRLTLDTSEDYIFLSAVFDYLYRASDLFDLKSILQLISEKPWLREINRYVIHKKVHKNLTEEIEEGLEFCNKQGLKKLKQLLVEYL